MPKKEKAKSMPQKVASSKNVGAGDIGSNKFHFDVCNEHGVIIDQIGSIPALGEGMSDKVPFFKEDNLKKAAKTLAAAAAMFQKHHVPPENTLSVGTAALRTVEAAIVETVKTGDLRAIKIAREIIQQLHDAFKPHAFKSISKEKKFLVAQIAKTIKMDDLSSTEAARKVVQQLRVVFKPHTFKVVSKKKEDSLVEEIADTIKAGNIDDARSEEVHSKVTRCLQALYFRNHFRGKEGAWWPRRR